MPWADKPSHEVHIHYHEVIDVALERKLDRIMAEIDDLQAKFGELDSAVRTLMTNQSSAVDALQTELNQLIADDEVENSKLEGLSAAADDLRSAVSAFGQQAPVELPPDAEPSVDPVDPTTGESTAPLDPGAEGGGGVAPGDPATVDPAPDVPAAPEDPSNPASA